MAAKQPAGGKPRKRKRKMRLSLKQSKVKSSDKYTDSLGWSQDVGRSLKEPEAPKAPDTLKIQCDMCGSMLKIPKPKRSRYTVSCDYPECGHVMKFD